MNDMMFFSIALFLMVSLGIIIFHSLMKMNGSETDEPEVSTVIFGKRLLYIHIMLAAILMTGVGLIFSIGLYVIWR